jgi:hypothetical protein
MVREGGEAGAAREAPLMLFSMDRNVVHIVALTMLSPSKMNLHCQMMCLLKVCLFLFRPQSVPGRSWRISLQISHPVSGILTESDTLLTIHIDVPLSRCCDLCNPSMLD